MHCGLRHVVFMVVVTKCVHTTSIPEPQPCKRTVVAHNVSELEVAVNDRSVCDIQLLSGSYLLADGLKIYRALSIRGNSTAIDGSLIPASHMRCNCLLTVFAGASVVLDHLVFMNKRPCSSPFSPGSTLCNIGTLTLVNSAVINNGGDGLNVSPQYKTLDHHTLNCQPPLQHTPLTAAHPCA